MDPRIKEEVAKDRSAVLDFEYSLVEEATKSFGNGPLRWVDIGCGPYGLLQTGGRLNQFLAGSIGIDLNREHLARNTGIQYRICASCYSLPLPDNSVDIIVCRWVFEHLEKPDQALREFSRVLKPGGVVYLKTPNLRNYGMLLSWATPTAFHNLYASKAGYEENTSTYYRANTPGKLRELARAQSLTVRRIELRAGSYFYYMFNRELYLTMRAVSRTVGKFTNAMQLTLLCVLQKPKN